jgi:hypothetical protein
LVSMTCIKTLDKADAQIISQVKWNWYTDSRMSETTFYVSVFKMEKLE